VTTARIHGAFCYFIESARAYCEDAHYDNAY